jgi:SAM-dependent methyltransferase
MSTAHVDNFEEELSRIAPFMGSTVERARASFGNGWDDGFGGLLEAMFSDPDRMRSAIKGYVRFCLEATKLQRRFEKERRYAPRTYEEASAAVYCNKEYMMDLYLPGILLSHYLWPHHFRQQLYFEDKFLPRVLAAELPKFADVGVGTGFYSRKMLCAAEDVSGTAFDISPYAAEYAQMQVSSFGVASRWTCKLQDVIEQPPADKWPFVLSVEVLEHLEDPIAFMRSLRAMLAPGGSAFITAALTAPNEDHIYLYNTCDEIIEQLEAAGFEVEYYQEEAAYEPRADEPVPRIAAFICK